MLPDFRLEFEFGEDNDSGKPGKPESSMKRHPTCSPCFLNCWAISKAKVPAKEYPPKNRARAAAPTVFLPRSASLWSQLECSVRVYHPDPGVTWASVAEGRTTPDNRANVPTRDQTRF